MWEIHQVQVELLLLTYCSNILSLYECHQSRYFARYELWTTNEPYQVLCEQWSHRLSVFPH